MQLSELVPIQRNLFILDTETTGPNPSADRIVEIGFLQLKPDGTQREWSTYINPGIPIPPVATHGDPKKDYPGHGITDDMVANSPTFASVAPHLLRGFKDCDYGGYSLKGFDLPLLRTEFERAGHIWSYQGACVIDAYRLWQLGEKRTLSDAVARFLKRSHEGAHGAMADIRASLEVIVEQLQVFQGLPHTLEQLQNLQWPRDPNAIDEESKFIWKNGVATCNFGKKFKDVPLHKMDKGYLKWMAEGNFAPDTKLICTEAIAGRFPKQPELPLEEVPDGV